MFKSNPTACISFSMYPITNNITSAYVTNLESKAMSFSHTIALANQLLSFIDKTMKSGKEIKYLDTFVLYQILRPQI